MSTNRSACMAQLVKCPTLDFSSGHDLVVCGFKPSDRLCADISETAACFGFCLPLSLCPSPTYALSLSLKKINKQNVKKKRTGLEDRELVGFYGRLCSDSSEPGACLSFCVSISLCPSPTLTLSLSQN